LLPVACAEPAPAINKIKARMGTQILQLLIFSTF
jgi:hypothetical protein